MSNTELNQPIDKSAWPRGEWDSEPDRVDFEHAGFPCMILRVAHSGHLCGYVGVPAGHPLFGVSYNQESALLKEALEARKNRPIGAQPGMGILIALLGGKLEARPEVVFDCHGGLTYSGECSGRICHVPKDGGPDKVWWFGFDCAHCDDMCPARENFFGDRQVYRNVEYVRRETERLAEQIAAL